MRPVRIAIAADLHVDDFGSRVDPETGLATRFIDGLKATRFIAETAKARGAQALVIAGDYTEKRTPAPPRVARIVEELRLGPARQIHVRGNHDTVSAGRSIVDVLHQVDGWDGDTTPDVHLIGDLAVCAIPFLGKSWLRARPGFESIPETELFRVLAEQYVAIAAGQFVAAEQMGAKAAILVGHQQLSGGRMGNDQMVFLGGLDLVVDSRALQAIGYKAIVFGHVHKAQTVIDDPACPVLFAGSAHRIDFAEENEEKSFVLLELDSAGKVSIERIPIPARRFLTIDDPRNGYDVAELGVRDAVVRVLNLDPSMDPAAVRKELEQLGALEVQEIRRRPVGGDGPAGGLSESLTAVEALVEYFAADPDADALVDRGRGILAEVA